MPSLTETERPALAPAAIVACAASCGLMVANIYYAQPLIALIAPALHLRGDVAGLIVTLTQLGYGAGLLLIVPLADRIENRRLIVVTLLASAVALAGVAASGGVAGFLACSVVAGMASAGAQVVLPYVAALTPVARRGRMVGNVMAGLLTGIMLARPAASLAASLWGWRSIFWLSAAAMLMLAGWLARALPARRPGGREPYGAILASLLTILRTNATVRRRAAYQALAFAIFNLFWTAAPLMLTARFGFDQRDIALFGLAGAAGATVAPVAGRLGDRGHVRLGTGIAGALLFAACLGSGLALPHRWLWAVVAFALVLDGAVQLNQVLGQRVIFGLPGEEHGRLNAIYMTMVFVVGAGGSALATLTYHAAGWWGAMGAGLVLAALFGGVFLTERRG